MNTKITIHSTDNKRISIELRMDNSADLPEQINKLQNLAITNYGFTVAKVEAELLFQTP